MGVGPGVSFYRVGIGSGARAGDGARPGAGHMFWGLG